MKKKAKTDKRTTLIAKMSGGGFKRILIPSGCKVTFGPLCPGSKHNNGSSATALRIYSGATQIACFVDVQSFYETGTVQCIQKVVKRANKIQNFQEDGVAKSRSVAVEVSEWRDELVEDDSADSGAAFKALKENHDTDEF